MIFMCLKHFIAIIVLLAAIISSALSDPSDTKIWAVFNTSYDFAYGVDDGTTRFVCNATTPEWRQYGGALYNDSHVDGIFVLNMLRQNNYTYMNYIVDCYDNSSIYQGRIYVDITDARSANVSYGTPPYWAVVTNASNTLYIPPLTQNIKIHCVTYGCTWGDNTRVLIPEYNISLMNINETGTIDSKYNYFESSSNMTADVYDLLPVIIQAKGSAIGIKNSDTDFSLLESDSTVPVTADTLLACATDNYTVWIMWSFIDSNTSAETYINNTDPRVSLNTTTGISTLLVTNSSADIGIYICRVILKNGNTSELRIVVTDQLPTTTITTTLSSTTSGTSIPTVKIFSTRELVGIICGSIAGLVAIIACILMCIIIMIFLVVCVGKRKRRQNDDPELKSAKGPGIKNQKE